MKYTNFKRSILYKFLSKINFKRYNFSKIYNIFKFKKPNISKILNSVNLKIYNLLDFVSFKKINFLKIFKNIYIIFLKFLKAFNIKRFKYLPAYFFGAFFIFLFLYLIIPKFYNFNYLITENKVCSKYSLKCSFDKNISYDFFPYPRITINNILINDLDDISTEIGKIKKIELQLSFKNLLDKEKLKITRIKLIDSKILINLKKINQYKKKFLNTEITKKINASKGEIKFFDNEKYITKISDINFKLSPNSKRNKAVLKGKFLGDEIYINFKSDKNLSKIFLFKIQNLNFYSKIEMLKEENKALLKLNKNRLTAIFDYLDDKIVIKHANLRNSFLDGKVDGTIEFSPYFNFDLNIDLNSLNFNSLYGQLTQLIKENKSNFFAINNKINGNLNLFVHKIRSKYSLVNSFESRLIFNNSNILLDRFLINLGKIGAADISGSINTNEGVKKFNFEKNIFIDNKKYFLNKFSIYGDKDISPDLYVSGNFNLKNLGIHINEISSGSKFHEEQIAFVEKEFNDILLIDGYRSLFSFPNFKRFVQSVLGERD